MTVRELIQDLLELDMESEVEIVANNGREYEEFSDIDVENEHEVSGHDTVKINFQTDGMTLIENDEFERMAEKIDEMEDEING